MSDSLRIRSCISFKTRCLEVKLKNFIILRIGGRAYVPKVGDLIRLILEESYYSRTIFIWG